MPSDSLPGFRDWCVTFCEFVSCFAIVTSFFKPAGASEAESEWFDKSFILGSASSVWAGCIFFVLLPRICDCCCCDCHLWFFYHPYFPASMQIWKLVIFGSNFYQLLSKQNDSGENEFELKQGTELVSSGILASCDFLISSRVIYTTFCSGQDDDSPFFSNSNPRPKRTRTWIFLNLWRDFGIISSLIKIQEKLFLVFLIVEIPATVLTVNELVNDQFTSQQPTYHIVRLTLITGAAVGLYLGSVIFHTEFDIVGDKTVPILLFACESVLAVCETLNRDEHSQRSNIAQQVSSTPYSAHRETV